MGHQCPPGGQDSRTVSCFAGKLPPICEMGYTSDLTEFERHSFLITIQDIYLIKTNICGFCSLASSPARGFITATLLSRCCTQAASFRSTFQIVRFPKITIDHGCAIDVKTHSSSAHLGTLQTLEFLNKHTPGAWAGPSQLRAASSTCSSVPTKYPVCCDVKGASGLHKIKVKVNVCTVCAIIRHRT